MASQPPRRAFNIGSYAQPIQPRYQLNDYLNSPAAIRSLFRERYNDLKEVQRLRDELAESRQQLETVKDQLSARMSELAGLNAELSIYKRQAMSTFAVSFVAAVLLGIGINSVHSPLGIILIALALILQAAQLFVRPR